MLPEHHHDEQGDDRTAEHIEAFLERSVKPPRRRQAIAERNRRPFAMDTRQDWRAAMIHETARHARYGRPVSVVLIRLQGGRSGAIVDRAAIQLADAIRVEAREPDRAVRLDTASFRLLLPETGNRAARNLVERIERKFVGARGRRPDAIELCVEVASAPRAGTLEDAVTEAETRLAAKVVAG